MAQMNYKRKPAQDSEANDEQISAAGDAIGGTDGIDSAEEPSVDTSAEDNAPEAPVTPPPAAQEAKSGAVNQSLVRMITGATPTLMAFLTGAGPSQKETAINEAQKFYKEGATKKTVLTKGAEGQPVYTDVRDSGGMDAWTKPASVRPISTAGQKIVESTDPATGKKTFRIIDVIAHTSTPVYDIEEGRVSGRSQPFSPITSEKVQDSTGAEKFIKKDVYGNIMSGPTISEGKGTPLGINKFDIDRFEPLHKEARALQNEMYSTKEEIAGALALLDTDPKNAIEQAAGIFKTAKIITREKITADEKKFVSEAPSVFQRLTDDFMTAFTNEQRKTVTDQMKNILLKLDNVSDKAMASVQDRYSSQFASNSSSKQEQQRLYDYASKQLIKSPSFAQSPTTDITSNKQIEPSRNYGGSYNHKHLKVVPRPQKERILLEIRKNNSQKSK
jgi:hypothetical protein